MKSMLRASLATAACLAATATILAPEAKAQTETFNFSGTIEDSCTFTNVAAGTLGLSTDFLTLTTDPAVGIIGTAAAAPATADIDCNGEVTITVNAPVETSAPASGAATLNATVTDGAGLNLDTAATPSALFGAVGVVTSAAIDVGMSAASAAAIPSGTYTFTVDVVVTP